MRAVFQWNLGSRVLELGRRTLIMGVVNVTPDSFSDGGLYFDPEKAVARALALLDAGADLIDIGGESTRPGAVVGAVLGATAAASPSPQTSSPRVSAVDELARVLPVITALKKQRPEAVLSIDTYKAGVARAAVQAGAEIVNDVSGFQWDPAMRKTLAELKCGAVLMHTRGRPELWCSLPPVGDIMLLVKRELRQWTEQAQLDGLKRNQLVLDPGFGFGKSYAANYPLLRQFSELQEVGLPLLAGTSRKSFLGRTLARNGEDAPVNRRLYGTLASETALILAGAHIIRTHDVAASVEAAKIADSILDNQVR